MFTPKEKLNGILTYILISVDPMIYSLVPNLIKKKLRDITPLLKKYVGNNCGLEMVDFCCTDMNLSL